MKEDLATKSSWFENQINYVESNKFGAMALILTAQSCWGSMAAMCTLFTQNYVLLGVSATVTMATNASFIGQSPTKVSLIITYISVITNLLILIFGLI